MYARGEGVSKDNAEAVKWYQKAADQGSATAQYSLGSAYHKGEGVPKNYLLSYVWTSIAAANGIQGLQAALDDLEKRMTPAQIEEAQGEAKRRFENLKAFFPRD
jgi:TPR repeat protein